MTIVMTTIKKTKNYYTNKLTITPGHNLQLAFFLRPVHAIFNF